MSLGPAARSPTLIKVAPFARLAHANGTNDRLNSKQFPHSLTILALSPPSGHPGLAVCSGHLWPRAYPLVKWKREGGRNDGA